METGAWKDRKSASVYEHAIQSEEARLADKLPVVWKEGRILLLVLGNAGWHANLKIPDGMRLIYLPPYSPEPQPVETLWPLVDQPIVNKHVATIDVLDAKIAERCIALAEEPRQIQSRTNFHWWRILLKNSGNG